MQQNEEAAINKKLKQQIDILEVILQKQLEEVQQLLLCTSAREHEEEEEECILTQVQLDALLEKETFALKVADITLETRQVKLLRQLRPQLNESMQSIFFYHPKFSFLKIS